MGNDGVAAVGKVLALLDCFKPRAEALSLVALTRAPGIHKTTVYRLINSLEHMSCVTRPESGACPFGPRLLYLNKLYEQSFHLFSVVEPVLYALAATTRESTSYYVIDHGQRPCLFRTESSEGLREARLFGMSLPLDSTAISYVLCYWGLDEALYDGAPELPLLTFGARDQYTATLATSVSDSGDKFMAAFTLSGAASRLEAMRTTDDFVTEQLQAASGLSRKLSASMVLYECPYGA